MKEYDANKIPLHVLGGNPDMPVPRTEMPPDEPKPWTKTKIVGSRIPRVDAYERVSGSAEYTYDVFLPNMLYAAVLRCPHAHAMVKNIDTSKAEKMPGVVKIITMNSPGVDFDVHGGMGKLFDRHCRFDGDEVAAIAAESPYQAADAMKAIEVEYEVLPFALDKESATKAGAPVIIADQGTGRRRSVGPNNSIIDPGAKSSRGDVEKGFAASDFTVERSFHNRCEIHAPLEVHGSVAKWDGDKLTLWDSTQGVFNILHALAQTLRVPFNNIKVVGKYVGGGFGAKLGIWKHHIIVSLLAKMTARPVKLMLSREDSLLCVGNRPFFDMKVKGGVKKDGTITALRHINRSSGGAFPYTNTVGFQASELYKCDNVELDEEFFLTNAGMGCATRAPGFPNGNWALEQVIDELAEKIGMDPVEFRAMNVPAFSQDDSRKRPYTQTGFRECLIEGAKAFGWKEAKARPKDTSHLKRGVGVAGGMWAYGGGWPPSTIVLKMYVDGSLTMRTGASDIGTGTKTILTMIVAEELGIPMERIRVENADTANTPYASASGGSKTLPTEGPTARNAAIDLRKNLFALAAENLGVSADNLVLADNKISAKNSPDKSIEVPRLLQSAGRLDVIGIGYRGPNPEEKIIRTWGAHFAEVEVNTLTGEVRLLRFLGANDSGRVINQLTFENQLLGGMTMGLGLAMTEGRIMDKRQTGKMVNKSLLDYKLPTAMEIPLEHKAMAVEVEDDECNNLGAKGLGEPSMVPSAAAIANAVYDATGVRMPNSPMTPAEVLSRLAEKRG